MMDEIIKFVCAHWRAILEACLLVVSVIICLIRKRPIFNQIDVIKSDILELLPELINNVEAPGDGSLKKASVVNLVHCYLKKKYNFTDYASLDTFISEAIESILSTPTKKKGN